MNYIKTRMRGGGGGASGLDFLEKCSNFDTRKLEKFRFKAFLLGEEWKISREGRKIRRRSRKTWEGGKKGEEVGERVYEKKEENKEERKEKEENYKKKEKMEEKKDS